MYIRSYNASGDGSNVPPASRKRGPRRGVAAVEFALVAPLFFLLIFGMIEVGRMIMAKQIMTNAARVGARAATLNGANQTDVCTAVANALTSAGVNGSTQTVSPDPSTASSGTPMTVTVSVPCSSISWTSTLTYFNNVTLTSTVVMTHE